MSETYSEFIAHASSEKIVLVHIEPAQRLMVWELHSGSIYKKQVSYYPISLEENGTPLTEVSSIAAINSAGKWFFDRSTSQIYLRTTTSENPINVFTVVIYRLFFSNKPSIYPYDLANGGDVYYEPLVQTVSSFGQQLENDDQVGIALEGNGSITLHNNSGYFEPIYDKLFWENKACKVYSLGKNVNPEDAQILYEGIIESKTYNAQRVQFNLKDFITVLRDAIPLEVFDGSEGTFPDSFIGQPKRRIYGRVAGLSLFPLDNVLDGFDLTGTWAVEAGSTVLTGTGTLALDECSPEDEIFYIDEAGEEQKIKIKSVDSDTQVTLADDIELRFFGKTLSILPAIPWRKKNREWHIAHHALREPQTTIATAEAPNRFTVVDASDIFADDYVTINSQRRQVKRVSGNLVRLRQSLASTPVAGNALVKSPILSCYYKNEAVASIQLSPERDFTYTNTSSGSTLTLEDLAEFNVTRASGVTGFVSFTNGSRIVIGNGTIFATEFRPRDWINAVGTAEWYEVLSVDSDSQLTLRTAFSTATQEDIAAKRKNPVHIGDETKIILDCLGKTEDGEPTGEWLKTASHVVEDLLIEAGLGSKVNSVAFDQAKIDNTFTMSLKIPLKPTDSAPIFRDVINQINQTVFANLHKDKDFTIVYDVLDNDKSSSYPTLRDTDILGWSVKSESKNIVKTCRIFHRHQDVDLLTGEESSLIQEKTSDIAQYLVKTNEQFEKDVYLYHANEADVILARYSFFKEVSQSILTITTKLQLTDKNIGDVLYFKLDRLYDRFGSLQDKVKIGVISAVKTNGQNSEIEVDDLASFFLTGANIAEDGSPDFADSSDDEKIRNGFIVEDTEIIDPYEFSYRSSSRIT